MNLKKFFSAPTNEPIRDKKAERNLFARRTLVAFIGILALSGVLFANIYHLQVVNYDMYQTRSNGNRIKFTTVTASYWQKTSLFSVYISCRKKRKI